MQLNHKHFGGNAYLNSNHAIHIISFILKLFIHYDPLCSLHPTHFNEYRIPQNSNFNLLHYILSKFGTMKHVISIWHLFPSPTPNHVSLETFLLRRIKKIKMCEYINNFSYFVSPYYEVLWDVFLLSKGRNALSWRGL